MHMVEFILDLLDFPVLLSTLRSFILFPSAWSLELAACVGKAWMYLYCISIVGYTTPLPRIHSEGFAKY